MDWCLQKAIDSGQQFTLTYFYKSIKYENIKTKAVIAMKTESNPLEGLDKGMEKSRITLNL